MDHCCCRHHYFFEIKKCGKDGCDICKPVRLPQEVFQQIKPFPNPEPGADDHYKSFEQIYGKETTEKFRPSFQNKPKKKRTLPFHGKLQHVGNADLMLECEECGMWRLVYAKRKLQPPERKSLEDALSGTSSCGSPLQELDLPAELEQKVYVRELRCHDPIEILYYTAKYEPICIYCGEREPFSEAYLYPQCKDCKNKQPIAKTK
jgi:hypothetical protein